MFWMCTGHMKPVWFRKGKPVPRAVAFQPGAGSPHGTPFPSQMLEQGLFERQLLVQRGTPQGRVQPGQLRSPNGPKALCHTSNDQPLLMAAQAQPQVGKRFLSPPSRHRGLQSVQPDTPRIRLWCHSTTPRAHTQPRLGVLQMPPPPTKLIPFYLCSYPALISSTETNCPPLPPPLQPAAGPPGSCLTFDMMGVGSGNSPFCAGEVARGLRVRSRILLLCGLRPVLSSLWAQPLRL